MRTKKLLTTTVATISLAAMPAMNVFASTLHEQDVTVGEVDTPIYDVDVSWGDMSFDWKYNEITRKYEFRPKIGCSPNVDGLEAWQLLKEDGNLYTDNQCTTLETGEIGSGHYYQKAISGGKITVTDNSVNGEVAASVAFYPTTDYSWVSGHVGSQLMGMAYEAPIVPLGYSPATGAFSYIELEGGVLADELNPVARQSGGYLYLTVNNPTNDQISNITSSDKIGTVTVGITPVYKN